MQRTRRIAAFSALPAAVVLALSACVPEAEDPGELDPPEDAQEAEQPEEEVEQDEPQEPTGNSIGTLTIDGNSFELTESEWCVEEGEAGDISQEILRVGARNADTSVQVLAVEVVTDDPGSGAYQQVEASAPVDDVEEFQSEHSNVGEYLVVDGTNVTIEDGNMKGLGPDGIGGSYDMATHFTISDEPGAC